jgi:hypothetical protein
MQFASDIGRYHRLWILLNIDYTDIDVEFAHDFGIILKLHIEVAQANELRIGGEVRYGRSACRWSRFD